jgi:hypothetical protein
MPVSTGKFNVDGDGVLWDLDGNVIDNGEFQVGRQLGDTTAIVLTIEPDGDTDAIPADTHYLAGSMINGAADLTVGHGAALGDDFLTSKGVYILATPTNGPESDENSGIWFLTPGSNASVGLFLPDLPAGWAYEGWVVVDGMPVTTGRFMDGEGADDAAPYSGAGAGPPFPGEDFLMNAPEGLTFPTDLAGTTAVISIEPSPDDSAGPFTLKPLVGMIPEEATDNTEYGLGNNAAGFPTGRAWIRIDAP